MRATVTIFPAKKNTF